MTHKTHKYVEALHEGSKASTHQHAKQLRQPSTKAEQKLWALLRNRQLKGKKFRRQHALAGYVLDFYCHECKLAIELDGSHHNQEQVKAYDKERTQLLGENKIKVLRFWNSEVLKHVEHVLEQIRAHLG